MAHIFKPEYQLLNRLLATQARTPIEVLEKRLISFGHGHSGMDCGHAEMGAWLMSQWGMPEPIIVATREHHNKTYRGPHDYYVHLIQLVDSICKQSNKSDLKLNQDAISACKDLGLDPEEVISVSEEIFSQMPEFGKLMTTIA